MKVLFEYGVDFVNFPVPPPTMDNCGKCTFHSGAICVKADMELCRFGQNGYFVKNYIRELPSGGR
jgi:hypothetical protein